MRSIDLAESSRLRILIAGGGTGGHIIPALAVARELKARYSAEILFVGTARGMESRLVPEAGFDLKLIEIGPLNQVSLLTRLRSLTEVPMSLMACTRIIRDFRADAVFGVGGYASGPAMGAAVLMRVPTMAFEPNAVPGMANRLIGKQVTAAAVNFPPAARWFRNAVVTGIPVRPEFFDSPPTRSDASPHLLIFGGSQGARIFNTRMPWIAPELLRSVPGLTLLHQAGARHSGTTRAAYEASGADPERWRVEAFLGNMAQEFAAADMVMARSGASTVAELAAAGKPSLLIPFAAAADDHQRHNAQVLVNADGAVMLEECELDGANQAGAIQVGASQAATSQAATSQAATSQAGSSRRLLETLTSLLRDPERLRNMASRAAAQARPRAAEHIADILLEIANRSRRRQDFSSG